MTRIVVQKEFCKGCGFCTDICKKRVLDIGLISNKKGYHYVEAVHPEACIGCGMCATICPDAAIELYREDDHDGKDINERL